FQTLTQMPDTSNTLMSELAVARHNDGHLELIATDAAGTDFSGSMFHRTQTATGDFTSWSQLSVGSKRISHVAAETNAEGSVEVIGVDTEGVIWHTRQNTTNPDTFTSWAQINGALRG
ncbi:hypothetical protein ACFV3E_46505, partial [Streptomyces sp. NPDC059718]